MAIQVYSIQGLLVGGGGRGSASPEVSENFANVRGLTVFKFFYFSTRNSNLGYVDATQIKYVTYNFRFP